MNKINIFIRKKATNNHYSVERFADSLKTVLVERTTTSWSFWFGLLQDYVDSVGDALVPTDYKVDGKYNLGIWVSTQRSRNEKLTTENKINSL